MIYFIMLNPPWNVERVVKKGDYLYAYVPSHPNCTKTGYVLHHRIIVENALGRLLLPNEIVHHVDHDKKNNDISNLEVMTQTEHSKLHAPTSTLIDFKCPECKTDFKRKFHKRPEAQGNKQAFCSSRCSGIHSRRSQIANGIALGPGPSAIKHGTRAGWQKEARLGLEHCQPCLDANRAYARMLRAKKNSRA